MEPTKDTHGYDLDDLNAAAYAVEMFGDDELERFANERRNPHDFHTLSAEKEFLSRTLPQRVYYSIETAAQNNIKYLRDPVWANPCDHIEIKKLGGGAEARVVAVIGHFPMNMYVGQKDPIDIAIGATPIDLPIFHEYTGPLSDTPEYLVQREHILERNAYPKR